LPFPGPRRLPLLAPRNVRRILAADQGIVLDHDPGLIVSVQSALPATLKGHKEARMPGYEVFSEAFKKVENPPKVRVPKRPARRRELAPA
jgi:hypothetical protein